MRARGMRARGIWDKVTGDQWAARAAVPNTVAAASAAFAPTRADAHSKRGFPSSMAHFYRHTSQYRSREHARALMRLRCCLDPFAASPTLHYGTLTACKRCPAAPPETAEHSLLDCPAYSHLRVQACFAPRLPCRRPPGRGCTPLSDPPTNLPSQSMCMHALRTDTTPTSPDSFPTLHPMGLVRPGGALSSAGAGSNL